MYQLYSYYNIFLLNLLFTNNVYSVFFTLFHLNSIITMKVVIKYLLRKQAKLL
jgi:hypothetical protein